jgi:hypothetical protein
LRRLGKFLERQLHLVINDLITIFLTVRFKDCLRNQCVISILAKLSRSLSEGLAGEGQYIGCLTPQTATTATESSATAFVALTPLTTMETLEVEQDDSKLMAEASKEERLVSPQEPSWQGWAELENDPVGYILLRCCPFAKILDRLFSISCYKNGALRVCKSEKSCR